MNGYRLAVIGYLAYPDRIREIYGQRPEMAQCTYEEQLAMMRTHPSMPMLPFARDFSSLGLEVAEFYPDVDALNLAWARDRGVELDWRGPAIHTRIAILLGQLAEFRPDALYVHGLIGLPEDFYAVVKDAVPSLRIVTGFEGTAVRKPFLRDVDLLFVCVPPFVEDARAMGARAEVLYHAFDPLQLPRLDTAASGEGPFDFTFVGSSGYGGENFHEQRYWSLFELLATSPLRAWLNEPELATGHRSLNVADAEALTAMLTAAVRSGDGAWTVDELRRAVALRADAPPLPLARLFPDQCFPPVYGSQMLALLCRSRVTFNMHTHLAAGAVGNYRLFEATGVGTCLLTDAGSNLAELFVPDEEVVVYNSMAEAREKVRWLLAHEEERRRIAERGQQRTLKTHTFARRCGRIDAAIRRLL